MDHEAFDRLGRVLRHLVVGLVDQTIHVRLVSADSRVKALSLGPVQAVLHKRLVWPTAGRRVERLLDDLAPRAPTLVHAITSASYRVGCAIAEAFDADLVLQVTSLSDCDAMANVGAQRVGRVVALTAPLKRILEEQLKVPPDRVDLIRPGIMASKSACCFSRSNSLPTILCPAPFTRGSGVDRLIEAAALLRKKGREFMLFLLGTGMLEPALRRLIRERGLSSCITLARPSGDLTGALHSGDIFVEPSARPGFSDDILQAMSAGLVIVTAPSAFGDCCSDDETAVVLKKNKADVLADALRALLDDPPRAQRIAAAGVEHIRAHHAVNTMAEQTAEAYRTLALARATFSLKE
jgi:glycosyltransferase involved in cell wall biosynthesis